jgi:hypothetical protein
LRAVNAVDKRRAPVHRWPIQKPVDPFPDGRSHGALSERDADILQIESTSWRMLLIRKTSLTHPLSREAAWRLCRFPELLPHSAMERDGVALSERDKHVPK